VALRLGNRKNVRPKKASRMNPKGMSKSSVKTHARRCSIVRGLRHTHTPKTTHGIINSARLYV
jgi:hypothetical protein